MKYDVRVGIIIGKTYTVEADDEMEAREIAETIAEGDSFSEFEVGTVNSEVICRYSSKIRIGDMVKVVNMGRQYSSYDAFFKEHNLSTSISKKFVVENQRLLSKDKLYYVMFKGLHSLQNDMVCVIQDMEYGDVYLIGEDGLVSEVED